MWPECFSEAINFIAPVILTETHTSALFATFGCEQFYHWKVFKGILRLRIPIILILSN